VGPRSSEGLGLSLRHPNDDDFVEALSQRWRLQALVDVMDHVLRNASETRALRVASKRHLQRSVDPHRDGSGAEARAQLKCAAAVRDRR
jgi:hypothetical protein